MFIVAPADDRTVVPKPAGVDIPGTDRDEPALRWCGLTMNVASSSPASNGAVALHTARMRKPGVDRREPTLGRRGLTTIVVAPAGDGAVIPHAAGMVVPCADGGEPARGRGRPARVIIAPADDGAVVSDSAAMAAPCTHCGGVYAGIWRTYAAGSYGHSDDEQGSREQTPRAAVARIPYPVAESAEHSEHRP